MMTSPQTVLILLRNSREESPNNWWKVNNEIPIKESQRMEKEQRGKTKSTNLKTDLELTQLN